MFDFEKAIRDWKNNLRKIETFEDRTIAELESHLRDEIGRRQEKGVKDEDAFKNAVGIVGRPESIAGEYHKANTRPLAIPSSWKTSRFSPALIWNYVKTAGRKARRQKAYSFINIAGLAVGMTCCLMYSPTVIAAV